MYEKEKSLLLAHGCSAVGNSLAVLRTSEATWAVWPHQNQLCLVRIAGDQVETRTVPGRPADNGQSIMQIRWCDMKSWTYLVVACTNGVDFYNMHGSTLLFSFPYSQEGGGGCFTRGIAAFVGKICVGTSDGSLLVFQSDSAAEGALHVSQRVRLHASAICDLAADQCHLVSADQAGNILQWAGKAGELTKLRQIDHYGSPCTGLALTGQLVVAVYGSGHLRLFSRDSGQVRAEATAHARWITGLDLAAESGLVITVAEDATVKVWQVSDSEAPLTHKFTEHECDARLMGAGFLRADGATFGLAAYDQKQLICYAM